MRRTTTGYRRSWYDVLPTYNTQSDQRHQGEDVQDFIGQELCIGAKVVCIRSGEVKFTPGIVIGIARQKA